MKTAQKLSYFILGILFTALFTQTSLLEKVVALAQILDKPITWDESTKSVYIGSYDNHEPDILLSDLDYFYAINNTFLTEETEKDNMGNTQKNVVYGSFNRKYLIEGFSRMTGVLFQKYKHHSDLNYYDWCFTVYGDDKLI